MIVRPSSGDPDVWVPVLGAPEEQSPEGLPPGAHVVLLTEDPTDGLRGRRRGLEVRDTILVVGVGRPKFAFLFRKEVEGTVAENVLRYGVGGLNIDGCRVRTNDNLNGGAYAGERRTKTTTWQSDDRSEGKGSGFRQGIGDFAQPEGRWPSNLVFVHGEGCRRAGTKKVRAITGTLNGSWRTGGHYSGGWAGTETQDLGKPIGYGDAEGNEEVPVYECEAGCPVAELDRQSGSSRSLKSNSPRGTRPRGMGEPGERKGDPFPNGPTYSDQGGASRFFPQFKAEAEVIGWLGRLIGFEGSE